MREGEGRERERERERADGIVCVHVLCTFADM